MDNLIKDLNIIKDKYTERLKNGDTYILIDTYKLIENVNLNLYLIQEIENIKNNLNICILEKEDIMNNNKRLEQQIINLDLTNVSKIINDKINFK